MMGLRGPVNLVRPHQHQQARRPSNLILHSGATRTKSSIAIA
jgi:hypothetical protein